MLDATKEIVIALINQKQICFKGSTDANIDDVKNAIKEIYKALLKTKTISTQDE